MNTLFSIMNNMERNYKAVKEAENIINSWITSEHCYIWFEDENGNIVFKPNEKIKIRSVEIAPIITEK